MKLPDRVRPALSTALGFGLAAVLLYTFHQLSLHIHYMDVVHELRAVSISQILAALLLTFLSFAALALAEVVSLRMAGLTLPRLRAWLVCFLSQAVVHTTGFGVVLGTSLRYRLYASSGLSLADVGRAQLVFSSGFGLATFVLLAFAFILEPAHLVRHVGGSLLLWQGAGGGVLLLAGMLLGLSLRGRPLSLFGYQFTPPAVGHSLRLLFFSVADLLACAGVLYVLLPPGLAVGYPALLGIFLAAIVIGLVSHVPGGLGVFEATVLLLLGPKPALVAATLGALLLFRVIYYFLPFALATLMLAGTQLTVLGKAGRWLRPVAPLTSALLTVVVGATLIFSGTTPVEHHRLTTLSAWVPLQLIEVSHLLASISGLVLVMLAYALRQRLHEAWFVALVLSLTGAFLALAKGLELGTAALLLLNSFILLVGRQAFYRKGSLMAARPTAGWWVALATVLGTALWLLFFSYKHVQYQHELWWQIELSAQASRSLRAFLAAAVVALLLGLRHLLRPARAMLNLPDAAELTEVVKLLETVPDVRGWIALTGDKYLLWSENRTAFLMYGVQGRTWVALGEPVGDAASGAELLWQFLERVDRSGGRPAFYQINGRNLTDYIDLGLQPYKLGETALVPLETFSLQGGKRSNLRASCNKADKAGLRFEWIAADGVPALLDELETISDAWLSEHAAREKRFSLGSFSRAYLARLPVAVVRREADIVAFANIWPSCPGGTLSLDLMRQRHDAPHGTMDYLMVQLMLAGREKGYKYFDLGMAPLSGLPDHPLAGHWAQVARLLVNHGERFYNFRGLRSYKDKFAPEWQAHYLLCRPRQLATVLLDISTLISGGLRGMVMK